MICGMRTKILKILLAVLAACFMVAGWYIWGGYREYQALIAETPISTAVERYTGQDGYLEYEEIDPDFVHAVVSVEDKRFFSREGFDWIALIRALLKNFTVGKTVEGGSTISQQIAKNLYHESSGRGVKEKISEVFIMTDLEKEYAKDDLLALYANMNYYGDGYYGLRQAAEGYYRTEPYNLSLAQAAMLAGIPNAPSVYQLSSGFELAVSRQHKVLLTMEKNGYITEAQAEEAEQEDVHPVSAS